MAQVCLTRGLKECNFEDVSVILFLVIFKRYDFNCEAGYSFGGDAYGVFISPRL